MATLLGLACSLQPRGPPGGQGVACTKPLLSVGGHWQLASQCLRWSAHWFLNSLPYPNCPAAYPVPVPEAAAPSSSTYLSRARRVRLVRGEGRGVST